MQIDWKRLILFWLGLYVAQIVIIYLLTALGVQTDTYLFLVLFDLCLGCVFSYFYYPRQLRRGLLKTPDYWKNSLIFFLILFVFDLIF